MAEQPTHLTEEVLNRLSLELAPYFPEPAQDAFKKRIGDYRQKDSMVWRVTQAINKPVEEGQAILRDAEASATLARQRLEQAGDFITLSPDHLYRDGMLKVLLGHIQVALYAKGDFLPPLLKPLKRWARPTHSYLDPFIAQRDESQFLLTQTQEEVNLLTEQAQLNTRVTLPPYQREAALARNRLLTLCDQQSAASKDLVYTYAGILPAQAEPASAAFARTHALEPELLEEFPIFTLDMKRFIKDPRSYARFIREYESLEGKTPSPEELKSLPKHPQEIWQGWIAFTLMEELSGMRLIEPPKIPAILLKP